MLTLVTTDTELGREGGGGARETLTETQRSLEALEVFPGNPPQKTFNMSDILSPDRTQKAGKIM